MRETPARASIDPSLPHQADFFVPTWWAWRPLPHLRFAPCYTTHATALPSLTYCTWPPPLPPPHAAHHTRRASVGFWPGGSFFLPAEDEFGRCWGSTSSRCERATCHSQYHFPNTRRFGTRGGGFYRRYFTHAYFGFGRANASAYLRYPTTRHGLRGNCLARI